MAKGTGSSGERDVAKFLTFGLTGQNKEYAFWRSPGSGSIGTVTGTNPNLHGDIIPLKPEAEEICNIFNIECKSGYSNASLDKHLKYNLSDPLRTFGEQTIDDAVGSNKYPMLIFKKKGFSTPGLGINNNIKKKLNKYLNKIRFLYLHGEDDFQDIYFFEYKEFFNSLRPETIKNIK